MWMDQTRPVNHRFTVFTAGKESGLVYDGTELVPPSRRNLSTTSGKVTAASPRGAGAARPSIPQEYSPPLQSNGGPRCASGATQGSGASPPPRVSGDTEVAPLQCGSIAAEFLPPQGRRQEWWRQCG